MMERLFDLKDSPIEAQELSQSFVDETAGAFVCFEGWVRNHNDGKLVDQLEYEAYSPLALKQGQLILEEIIAEMDLIRVYAVHRVGLLKPKEMAVWVGVSSVHRGQAFEACQMIIDRIKAEVPIWKNEFYADGTQVWVDPTKCSCAKHLQHSHKH